VHVVIRRWYAARAMNAKRLSLKHHHPLVGLASESSEQPLMFRRRHLSSLTEASSMHCHWLACNPEIGAAMVVASLEWRWRRGRRDCVCVSALPTASSDRQRWQAVSVTEVLISSALPLDPSFTLLFFAQKSLRYS
jgi:hypothetical protein